EGFLCGYSYSALTKRKRPPRRADQLVSLKASANRFLPLCAATNFSSKASNRDRKPSAASLKPGTSGTRNYPLVDAGSDARAIRAAALIIRDTVSQMAEKMTA